MVFLNLSGFLCSAKTYGKPVPRLILTAVLSVFLNQAAYAGWTTTLTCGYTGALCGGLANICPAFPLPATTKAECESFRSLVVSACVPMDTFYECTEDGCCDGYCSLTACTGSDDSFGAGGSFSNFGGNGITSGAGGLGNNFGATRLTGPYQGEATFTSHNTTANKQWMEETRRRLSAIGSLRDEPVPPTTRGYEQNYAKKTCADYPGAVCLMDATREAPNMDEVSGKGKTSGDAPPVMGGSYGDDNPHLKTADVPPPPNRPAAGDAETDITNTPGWKLFETLGGTTIDYACKSGVPLISQIAMLAKATLTTLDVSIRGEELNATEQERRIKLLANIVEQQKQAKTPEELAALTEKAKKIKFGEVTTLVTSYGTAAAEKILAEKLTDKFVGKAPEGLGSMKEALFEAKKGIVGGAIGKATEMTTDTVNKLTFKLTTGSK